MIIHPRLLGDENPALLLLLLLTLLVVLAALELVLPAALAEKEKRLSLGSLLLLSEASS